MGYQEAYVTTKKKSEFEDFVKYIQSLGKEYFDEWGSYPVEIITFTKAHYPFKKNDKVVYFCGERYPLYHFNIIDDYDNQFLPGTTKKRCSNSSIIREENIEEYLLNNLKKELSNYKFKVNLHFTEEVNPQGIWKADGEVTDCNHIPLNFTE